MESMLSISNLAANNPLFYGTLVIIQIASVVLAGILVKKLFLQRKMGQKDRGRRIANHIEPGCFNNVMNDSNSSKIFEVARAGIKSYLSGGNSTQTQEAMDEILLEEQSEVEKHINLFALMANVATLIGLVGSVYSFLPVFQQINESMSDDQKSKIFAEAVSLSMNSTVYGILVAVPALIMYAVFNTRAISLTDDLNKGALKVFMSLGYHYLPKSANSLPLAGNDFLVNNPKTKTKSLAKNHLSLVED